MTHLCSSVPRISNSGLAQVFLAAALLALQVPGAGFGEPTNFLSNSSFVSDLGGWTVETGSWSFQASDGVGQLGSAQVSSSGSSRAVLSQCADVSTVLEGVSVGAAGVTRALGHVAPLGFEVELFSSTDCSGTAMAFSEQQAVPASDGWIFNYALVEVPAGGAASARVRLVADATAAGQVSRFDSVYLRPSVIVDGHFQESLDTFVQTPPGTFSLVTDGDSDPLGAVEATVAGDGSAFMAQCVNLENFPGALLYFATVKIKAPDELVDYVLSFQFWDSQGCAPPGTLLTTPFVLAKPAALNTWQSFGQSIFRPIGARSASVYIALNPGVGTPGTTFVADDFALLVTDLIMATGFEGGDLSAFDS